MEELVHRYLTKNYILEDNLGYDIMCKHDGYRKNNLCVELAKVFTIAEKEARAYSDTWAINQVPDVDLHVYWVMSVAREYSSVQTFL